MRKIMVCLLAVAFFMAPVATASANDCRIDRVCSTEVLMPSEIVTEGYEIIDEYAFVYTQDNEEYSGLSLFFSPWVSAPILKKGNDYFVLVANHTDVLSEMLPDDGLPHIFLDDIPSTAPAVVIWQNHFPREMTIDVLYSGRPGKAVIVPFISGNNSGVRFSANIDWDWRMGILCSTSNSFLVL